MPPSGSSGSFARADAEAQAGSAGTTLHDAGNKKATILPSSPGPVANGLRYRDKDPQRPIGMPTTTEGEAQNWDAAIESAIPEEQVPSGRAGNLYFDFPGKTTKVKSLVLQYSGPGGKLDLRLR